MRRHCLEHTCAESGPGWTEAECADIQHRQNADLVTRMLAMLDLPGEYIEVTDEHRRSLMGALKDIPAYDIHTLNKDVAG